VTVRATARGAERTSLEGTRVDVLVCGASFAGLAVARELARLPLATRPEVLVVDRYEVGERQTSACAVPTPWLHAMGGAAAARQELPDMTFTTPHGSVRYRLPWSWTAFDYRTLCEELWAQCGEARFETAKVEGRGAAPGTVVTDRGTLHAAVVVDALGWRRVLASDRPQPPEAPLSRGLEVHPDHDAGGTALDVWVERSLARRGYGWRVPAGGEARVGVGSYDPHEHVKAQVVDLAEREGYVAERYQGNWFPHRLREATEDGVFFAGDSAGHCFPLSGEGIRTAFYFGIAAAREIRGVLAGEQSLDTALGVYAAFHASHARAFAIALRLQRLVPALPPRVLTAALRVIGRQSIVDRSFGWYLRQADPSFALVVPPVAAATVVVGAR
jgi:flavin-dependent dehydrogenase